MLALCLRCSNSEILEDEASSYPDSRVAGDLRSLLLDIENSFSHAIQPVPTLRSKGTGSRSFIVFQEAERGYWVWPRMACMNVECHTDFYCVPPIPLLIALLTK